MSDSDPVLTLADLAAWSFPGTALALLGQPIKHSISPAMHNAALRAMAVSNPAFADWKYFRFEVPPADLPQALRLLHERKFRGVNLTVPHKVLAVPHLSAIDPAAAAAGAVNTLKWTESGWHGYNTDGYGLALGVREALDCELKGSAILLLGAGGAARGAAVECLLQGCASLHIMNRTRESLENLLSVLQPLAGATSVHGLDPADAASSWPPHALVINATSSGLKVTDKAPIDLNRLALPTGVYDMIYNPPRTPLLCMAEQLDIPHGNGLSMLIHQGAKALAIWSNADVPVAVMRAAAEAALR